MKITDITAYVRPCPRCASYHAPLTMKSVYTRSGPKVEARYHCLACKKKYTVKMDHQDESRDSDR